MTDKVHHVLFVCTGNSARPSLAEGLLNHFARGRFIHAGRTGGTALVPTRYA